MAGGAPAGNKNAAKSKPWQAAIQRALAKRSLEAQRDALDELAEKLLSNCDAGDMAALKELGDRLDGKPAQALDVDNTSSDGSMTPKGLDVSSLPSEILRAIIAAADASKRV